MREIGVKGDDNSRALLVYIFARVQSRPSLLQENLRAAPTGELLFLICRLHTYFRLSVPLYFFSLRLALPRPIDFIASIVDCGILKRKEREGESAPCRKNKAFI